MANKTFEQFIKKESGGKSIDEITVGQGFVESYRRCWKAATKAAIEKFNRTRHVHGAIHTGNTAPCAECRFGITPYCYKVKKCNETNDWKHFTVRSKQLETPTNKHIEQTLQEIAADIDCVADAWQIMDLKGCATRARDWARQLRSAHERCTKLSTNPIIGGKSR